MRADRIPEKTDGSWQPCWGGWSFAYLWDRQGVTWCMAMLATKQQIFSSDNPPGNLGLKTLSDPKDIFRTSLQAVQKGCPARPQQAKRRGVRFGTLSL
jgi:elongation factor P hydroxylase